MAVLRYAINDVNLERPWILPVSGNDPSRAIHAFSDDIDDGQYDKMIAVAAAYLDPTEAAPVAAELERLKKTSLLRPPAHQTLVLQDLPETFFGSRSKADAAMDEMTRYITSPPQARPLGWFDDFLTLRQPISLEETALCRWILKDRANALFVPITDDPSANMPCWISTENLDDLSYLADQLALLEKLCREERRDNDLCNQIGALAREIERVYQFASERDFTYQFTTGGGHEAKFGFWAGITGRLVAASIKIPAAIRWMGQYNIPGIVAGAAGAVAAVATIPVSVPLIVGTLGVAGLAAGTAVYLSEDFYDERDWWWRAGQWLRGSVF